MTATTPGDLIITFIALTLAVVGVVGSYLSILIFGCGLLVGGVLKRILDDRHPTL